MKPNKNPIINFMEGMVKHNTFSYDRLYFLLGLKPVLRLELEKNKNKKYVFFGLKNFKKCCYDSYAFISKDIKKAKLAKRLTQLQKCSSLNRREEIKREIYANFGCYLQPAETIFINAENCKSAKISRLLPPKNENTEIEILLGKLYGYPKCCAKSFNETKNHHAHIKSRTAKELLEKKLYFKYKDIPMQLIHLHCSLKCKSSNKLVESIKSRLKEEQIPERFLHMLHKTTLHKDERLSTHKQIH